jgi:hypothetical protein
MTSCTVPGFLVALVMAPDFQARHIQQVAHQAGSGRSASSRAFSSRELAPWTRSRLGAGVGQERAQRAGDRHQRRAQVVGNRVQQRRSAAFPSTCNTWACRACSGQMGARHAPAPPGWRRPPSAGAAPGLSGRSRLARPHHAQHADDSRARSSAAGSAAVSRRQCGGVATGRLAMLTKDPVGHRQLLRVQGRGGSHCCPAPPAY